MSEYANVTPELMAGFLDEAPEYLEMLDEGLLAFESKAGSEAISLSDPDDQERMNTMFRAAHSLKGLAAAMAFDKIRDLTHLMETLFDQLRMGKRALDPASIETLFGVFDKLRDLVGELAEPPAEPVTIDDALKTLEEILSTPGSPTEKLSFQTAEASTSPADQTLERPASEVPDATVAETRPTPGDTEGAKKMAENKRNLVLEDPELIRLFVETTAETIDELNQGLLKLEQNPANLEIINEVFRCVHNIKGATGAAGCEGLCHLTHDMETILDRLRSERMSLTEELTNTLLGVADRLRGDIELVKSGQVDELSSDGTVDVFAKWLGESPSARAATPPADVPAGLPETHDNGDASKRSAAVTVVFPKDSPESGIQAYLIHSKLNELGEVLKTVPDVDSLDGSEVLEQIVYHVCTSCATDEIERLVGAYSIESVRAGTAEESEADSPPCETASAPAETKSKERAVDGSPTGEQAITPAEPAESPPGPAELDPADVKPAPSAATSPAGKTPPPPQKTQANKQRAAAKVGETLRVDLDRLDQLMNLGGELVINRARFVQIHRQLGQLFTGGNVGYLVDDIAERIKRLNEDIAGLSRTGDDRKIVKDLSDTTHLLTHDFDAVRGIVHQVHESRSTMNDFSEALHSLNRVSEGMQKRIMETRMVSVGPLFQRFRRVIRDISKSTGKEVELLLSGETTELDKRMIDELGDPLTHMVRNSVDHGIELPEERVKAGKPRVANIVLNAYHRGRHICIEVRDDGKGVNVEAVKAKILEKNLATPAQLEQMSEKEIIQYVFKPGFSTAERVTDLSGRGMGMDIVINKLENINGTVEIDSETGKGAVVTIRLPLTLAIITSLIARIGKGVYAVPLEMVAEIISVPRKSIRHIQKRRVIQVRDRVIPVALFEQVFDTDREELQTRSRDDDEFTLVILGFQDEKIGLVVDEMIGQEDIVIKNLATNFRNVNGIAGASIMGDGTVSLILDVSAMMTMFADRSDRKTRQSVEQESREKPQQQEPVSCGEESDADNTLCAAVEAS